MGALRSYDPNCSHRDYDSEIERLRAQMIFSWKKEARTLAWFGLRDGMSLLELGSGPGFVTEQLLTLLPTGSVTAVEIDAALVDAAKRYLQAKTDGRLRFVNASIMSTGLPENSFDFAIARLIFQHLPDPVRAAKEVSRVLRPGGKLVIIDSDDAVWGLADPRIPELSLMMERYSQVQSAGGGNRLVGRDLCHILDSAGFVNVDFEAVAVHSDILGIGAFLAQFDPDRLLPLVTAGLISNEELEQFRASRLTFLTSARPVLMMLVFMACGTKSSCTE